MKRPSRPDRLSERLIGAAATVEGKQLPAEQTAKQVTQQAAAATAASARERARIEQRGFQRGARDALGKPFKLVRQILPLKGCVKDPVLEVVGKVVEEVLLFSRKARLFLNPCIVSASVRSCSSCLGTSLIPAL